MMRALSAEVFMFARTFLICTILMSASLPASAAPSAQARDMPAVESDGTVAVRSAYPMAQTIERLKQDFVSKGITFFIAIEHRHRSRPSSGEQRSLPRPPSHRPYQTLVFVPTK